VTRPLVPVTLALMAGIAAPAWGLHLPEPWLLAGGVALWVALALLWWQRRPARFLPLIFFALLGVAFYQQAWQPDFHPGHLAKLPQNQNLTLFGHLNRPGKLGGGTGPALHGSRGLAEPLGLAARGRENSGPGSGSGAPAGGNRPGG